MKLQIFSTGHDCPKDKINERNRITGGERGNREKKVLVVDIFIVIVNVVFQIK